MISVWYDPDCDEIWITDADRSYARRSLWAYIDPSTDKIGIRLKAGSDADIVLTAFGNLAGHDGQGFASAAEAKAYLDREFAKQRRLDILSAQATAGAALLPGMPVAVSRQDGCLIPARADTYALAFVVGLAEAEAAPGFPSYATQSPVTLDDWTAVAGAPSLAVGQPYFLALAGGLSVMPVTLPGACNVRVGNASDPQTLILFPSDPILL